jgi:hypothetical protein
MDHPREISSGIIALSRRVLEWMRANPGTALTALGFILYGLLRIGYELFYRPFGVAPDEVGFGYGQILSQSATGAVVLIFFSSS